MKARVAWIAGIVGLVVMVFIGVFLAMEHREDRWIRVPLRPPIATAEFADGSSLQVLQVGIQRLEDGQMAAKTSRPSWFALPWMKKRVGARLVLSEEYRGFGMRMRYVCEDEVTIGMLAEADAKKLLVEVRGLEKNKKPERFEMCYVDGLVEAAKDGRATSGSRVTLPAEAEPLEFPGALVQMADGCGGWISGNGPYEMQGHKGSDPEGRAVVNLPGWLRSENELTLRVIKPGQPAVLVMVPNPQVTPRQSWPATETLQVESKQYSLGLDEIGWKSRPGLGSKMLVSYRFISKVGDADGNPLLQYVPLRLVDDLGNVQKTSYMSDRIVERAFVVCPDARKFKLQGTVAWTLNASRIPSDCTMVLEGRVSEDGLEFIPDPSFVVPPGVDTAQAVLKQRDGKVEGVIQARGKATSSGSLILGGKTITDFLRCQFVVFLGEEQQSRGHLVPNRAVGGFAEWSLAMRWSGTWQPNQRVRIGIAGPLPNLPVDDLIFTRERVK